MKKVLFVCVGNSARSIIAEALFNVAAPGGWEALSAGTKPASRISDKAATVLVEIGIKVEKKNPSVLDPSLAKNADIGITMGCGVEDDCPVLFTPIKEDWDLDDPKGAPIEKFRRVRGEIKKRVDKLVMEIESGAKG